MHSPLNDLRKVRQHREDVASSTVNAARRHLEDATEQLAQSTRELEQYIDWRINREETLYQEVLQQLVHPRELDDLKVQVQLMRDGESSYRNKVDEAERAVEAAQEVLRQALEDYRRAVKERTKLDEYDRIGKALTAKELDRRAEAALEDLGRKPDLEEAQPEDSSYEYAE